MTVCFHFGLQAAVLCLGKNELISKIEFEDYYTYNLSVLVQTESVLCSRSEARVASDCGTLGVSAQFLSENQLSPEAHRRLALCVLSVVLCPLHGVVNGLRELGRVV